MKYNNYNVDGLKYFLYNITNNRKYYMCMPTDIRRLIWKYSHDYNNLKCYICNKLLLDCNINIFNNLFTDNFIIINSISTCVTCDSDIY